MNTLVSQGTDLRSEEEIASLLRERAMKCGLIPRPEVQNKEELVKLKKRADEFVTLVREGGTISPAKLRAFCRDVEFRLCWIAKSELYGINTAAQKAVLDGVAQMNAAAENSTVPLSATAQCFRNAMKESWKTHPNSRYMLHVIIGMYDNPDMETETCADDEPIDEKLLQIARAAMKAIGNVAAALKVKRTIRRRMAV